MIDAPDDEVPHPGRQAQNIGMRVASRAFDIPGSDTDHFPQVTNITTAAAAIASVAIHPNTFNGHGMVNLPMTLWLEPISIMTIISGTAVKTGQGALLEGEVRKRCQGQ